MLWTCRVPPIQSCDKFQHRSFKEHSPEINPVMNEPACQFPSRDPCCHTEPWLMNPLTSKNCKQNLGTQFALYDIYILMREMYLTLVVLNWFFFCFSFIWSRNCWRNFKHQISEKYYYLMKNSDRKKWNDWIHWASSTSCFVNLMIWLTL